MKKSIACNWLRLTESAFVGPMPASRQQVLIAAPHMSNWDFVHRMAMAWSLDARLSWMVKASLFVFALGGFFRALGGIAIRRDRRANLVEQSVECFARDPALVLAAPAEGTRVRGSTWRSAFYHIARLAEAPIVLGCLDCARERGGLGPEVRTSGNVRADMGLNRAFDADKVARHPAKFTAPLLTEASDAR